MSNEIQKIKINGVETEHSVKYLQTPLYQPFLKEQEVIKNVWSRYSEMRTNRDLNYKWFGKTHDGTYRTLTQYIDVCEKRWNSDGIPRTNLESWQASVFKPETRNKIIAILSAVAQQRPKVKFRGVEESDYLREQILRDLYDWSENKDNGDEMALYTMLDAIIHGTAIRYEGYEDSKRVIKELTPGEDGYDLYDLKYKEKTIIKKRVFTREVRLQDFYFGTVTSRHMDEQPDCVWRKLMRINQFKEEFSGWDEAKYVLPGGDLTDETFFSGYVSEEIRERESELVEVIRYYSRESDEFVILANGVWVNPMGKGKVCPIPFSHKELPFFSVVFEPFASDFPYGKAAPDKYLGEQDAINALYNMMLDQVFVSVHRPLVTGDEDYIDDVDLVPGKVNYIGADIKNVMELDISPPAPAHFNMLNTLHQSIQESSVDSVQQGQSGGAGTATEVREASAAAARTFSLFLQFVFHGWKRKAKLRTGNILQFMTMPDEIEKVLGDEGEAKFSEAFGAFKIGNVQMLNGKEGNRIIQLVPDQESLQAKLAGRMEERTELEGQNTEKIYITPEYIREFQYDIESIPDSTIKETDEVNRALEMNFQQGAMTMYPDMMNREAMFDEFLKVWKKDSDKLKMPKPMMNPMMNPQNPQQAPGGGMAQQVVNRATGGPQAMGTGKPSLNMMRPK